MGWSSGTRVFDKVCGHVLGSPDRKGISTAISVQDLLIALVDVLEDLDWDCQEESRYFNHPLVREILVRKHPDWDWDWEE